MANPRNIVAFEGIRTEADIVTFKIDEVTIVYTDVAGGAAATMLNKAVSLSADNTVQLASDAEAVIGKLLHVEPDGKCAVQVGGYVTLPGGNAATLTRGNSIVGALGAAAAKGYIRVSVAAESPKARGFIQENGTTTAVLVRL